MSESTIKIGVELTKEGQVYLLKELEVYKEALYEACNNSKDCVRGDDCKCGNFDSCKSCKVAYFLKKARSN